MFVGHPLAASIVALSLLELIVPFSTVLCIAFVCLALLCSQRTLQDSVAKLATSHETYTHENKIGG